MTPEQAITLLPLLTLAGLSILLLFLISFYRSHRITFALTLAGFAAAFCMIFMARAQIPQDVTPLLVVDSYSLFYTGLVIASAFMVTLLSYNFLSHAHDHVARPEEFYLLLVIATLGSVVLASSVHFASLFLGLEILTISLYPLINYPAQSPFRLEAAVKYLILAGVSSAFLLFGMALVYAETGALQLGEIALRIADRQNSILLWAGFGLMVVGLGFKLALVPFHQWTPDVFQGAPAPVTAFIASVSKSAVFALLLRYYTQINFLQNRSLATLFAIVAVASMIAGNLLALRQTNVKRLLAYSSIAHLGYILTAFIVVGDLAGTAVSFYLVAYSITIIGAFGVVSLLGDTDGIESYYGLAWQRPWLAAIFTAMLLSLAGIPVTAGFIGKFYIIAAGAAAQRWGLIIVLAVTSAIGLAYYLRVIIALFRPLPISPKPLKKIRSVPGEIALAVLSGLLLWLGIYPGPFLQLLQIPVN
jgi:NADH-quinone oxidoreductase subunit N